MMNRRLRQLLTPALALAALSGCGGGEDTARTDNTLITELNQLDTVDGTISDDMTVLDGATLDSDNAAMVPDVGAMDNVAEPANAM
ncbi:hypothetical protein ACNI3Q_11625 [Sphingomonas sp. FW199]|uniref:hypothetical protein n=1 Tax=Sphingomonas sp. FW199 TaxID=3400217 RepID=UPI003CFA6A4C